MDRFAARFEKDHLVISKAKGAWLYDKKNEKWLDFLLGNCTQTLGHCHPRLVEAIGEQASKALNVGDHVIEKTHQLAEMICCIGKKDQLRFVNSGSEACHLAIRLARAGTGRRLILKFNGHYHGWFGEEVSKFLPTFPYHAGLSQTQDFISIPWNDPESLWEALEQYSDKIAAIICEPVLCHAGVIPPLPGFLKLLSQEAKKIGAFLIFDECITGFRIALGGAQEYYDVCADLVIYSKALSQGVPFSVCAGSETAMRPLAEGSAYQGASYDAHPLGVTAALETLKIFQEEKTHFRLKAIGEHFQEELGNVFREWDFDVCTQGIPGAFQFFFTKEKQLINYEQVFKQTNVAFNKELIESLRHQKIQLGRGDIQEKYGSGWMGQWFYSTAHGEEELEFTKKALQMVLAGSKKYASKEL